MECTSDNVVKPKAFAHTPKRCNYSSPHEVVEDASLTIEEKKSLLAEWASDAHAVNSQPTLRQLPGAFAAVTFLSIMQARARLDETDGDQGGDDDPPPSPRAARPCFELEELREAA